MLRNYQAGANNSNRGSGTSMVLVYLALVSISSAAFATVKLNNQIVSTDAQAGGLQTEPQTYREKKLVQLTKYRGQIYRGSTQDSSQSIQSSDDAATTQNSVYNPLAKVWLTEEQTQLLKTTFDIAYEDGGYKHARLMQGILLQETIAGLMGRIGHMTAPVGKRSYGVMQVKVSAAKDVLGKHVKLGRFKSEEEIIASLIIDDEFNIRVASKFFLHLRSRTDSDEHAMMAYNLGLRASRKYKHYENFRYVKKVNRYLKHVVTPFNERFNFNSVVSDNAVNEKRSANNKSAS